MSKIISLIALSCILLGCKNMNSGEVNQPAGNKVLFICSSEATFNAAPNGTFLPEIAEPIYELHKAGLAVDVLSPAGGAIPIYYKFDTSAVLREAIESDYYQTKIANSLTVKKVDPKEYAAVVIPGGYAQFTDLHTNEGIKQLIVDHYERGGMIGTIGHGAALLAGLQLSNGNYLVDGVTMTSFPDWNERNIMTEADKGELLPFLMGEELVKNGAKLRVYDHDQKTNHEVTDEENKVVTAAFSTGGPFVASTLVGWIRR